MSHFSSEDWADIVRGVTPAKAAMLRSHLDQGCQECHESLETWRIVSACFAREAAYSPPEATVRIVKAAFNSGTRWAWLAQIAQTARLVFDSFQEPTPAMVRASGRPSRQLVHEAEPFVIDLRLQSDPVRKRVSLIGQILNSANPENAINRVDVVLLSGEDVLMKTSANAAGEFDLEFSREGDLRLFINIRGQRAIGIVLPDVES